MRNINVIFIVLATVINLKAQSNKISIPENNKAIIRHDSLVLNVTYTKEKSRIKKNENRYCYWFDANDIKITKGGYSGKLLDGDYNSFFYQNKNLYEQGKFNKGFKHGVWKKWYLNGEYDDIITWKNGVRRGRFYRYDDKGKLIQTGKYQKDKLQGKIITYVNDSIQIKKFHRGRALPEKSKSLTSASTKENKRVKKQEKRSIENPEPGYNPSTKKRFWQRKVNK